MVMIIILFYTFFVSFAKKPIWHFDVTWLLSREFTRRDFKPVASS